MFWIIHWADPAPVSVPQLENEENRIHLESQQGTAQTPFFSRLFATTYGFLTDLAGERETTADTKQHCTWLHVGTVGEKKSPDFTLRMTPHPGLSVIVSPFWFKHTHAHTHRVTHSERH